ncbi:MAG: hypothetical protein JOY79_09590 [Acidobacteriaceae bacterium]|nr:hypothetical protein [Acidobacteriaceae bacterium]
MSLAQSNDQRGGHSWGVVKLDNGIEIDKGLGDMGDGAYAVLDTRSMYGHCRWATHGEKTIENAHPFEIGHLVGAHNGVLSNHLQLNMKYQRAFKVDSMHLFAHLRDGLPFDDIEGYGAIEWVDRRDPKVIRLARLRNGQLAVYGIGTPRATVGVVWSSDERHLVQALNVAGIDTYFSYHMTEGAVYKVTNGEIRVTSDELHLKKPVYKPAKREKTRKIALVNSHGLLDDADDVEDIEDMPKIDWLAGDMKKDEMKAWLEMMVVGNRKQ